MNRKIIVNLILITLWPVIIIYQSLITDNMLQVQIKSTTKEVFQSQYQNQVPDENLTLGDYLSLGLIIKSISNSTDTLVEICGETAKSETIFFEALSGLEIRKVESCRTSETLELVKKYRLIDGRKFGYVNDFVRGDFLIAFQDDSRIRNWKLLRMSENDREFWLVCDALVCNNYTNIKKDT